MFEFFKVLLDNDQTEKKVEFNDLFYKEVFSSFLTFLSNIENASPNEEEKNQEDTHMREVTEEQ